MMDFKKAIIEQEGDMIYLISFVIYVLVFVAGFYVVKKHPSRVEQWLGRLCFGGLLLQLSVNYLFWGEVANFNPLATLVGTEHSAVNLMYLALISIFCYASLLVLLFKANDFYNE